MDEQVAVVAEIGVNHEGSVGAAFDLLRLAAGSGVDAVKFQTYTASRFISSSDPERLKRVERFCLESEALRALAEEATTLGVTFFSTPVTEDVVPYLDAISPVFKIASGDLTFEPTIRAVARTGKPTLLSTGAGDETEIAQAIDWFAAEVGTANVRDRLVLMHCVSSYPAPPEQANLLSIPFLRERFGLRVGYSNHVLGSQACETAVALGACVVEAHFTDSKTGRVFRDHALSLEPSEMAALTRAIPTIRATLGERGRRPQPCEVDIRSSIRKGIVAAVRLQEGATLQRSDLMFARPATGFPSAAMASLVGRRLLRDLEPGEAILPMHLDV
ncbi:MAG: N-acetylneuraminate synthase family protein [Magnetococcales bacterium]|nr:N-acetylneuraminate synthase family protein [Magnetococcales bacterium]